MKNWIEATMSTFINGPSALTLLPYNAANQPNANTHTVEGTAQQPYGQHARTDLHHRQPTRPDSGWSHQHSMRLNREWESSQYMHPELQGVDRKHARSDLDDEQSQPDTENPRVAEKIHLTYDPITNDYIEVPYDEKIHDGGYM